jgi:hypothetical protein
LRSTAKSGEAWQKVLPICIRNFKSVAPSQV